MTLFLTYTVKPRGHRGDDDRRPVGVFSLFAKTARSDNPLTGAKGDIVITRFYCQDEEEDKQKQLRFIETYCRERNITIGNPEQWHLEV